MAYVELHARSAFSFLRGASLPEHLAETAIKNGLTAMALCDRNGVYGAPRFYTTGRESGLRPLVGSELTLEDGTVLPVLVKNGAGYRNLCRMLTRSQLRAPKGESRILWKELEEFQEGLIALTGDTEGPLYQAVHGKNRGKADEVMERLVRAFGRRSLYVELQRHRVSNEERITKGLIEIARSHDVPIVATNGVLYAEPWGRTVHDVFTCIRHHTHLDAAGTLLDFNSQRHVKTAAQMEKLFADLPEAITNTERIAAQMEFTLKDLGYAFSDRSGSCRRDDGDLFARTDLYRCAEAVRNSSGRTGAAATGHRTGTDQSTGF
jgi:error-prone DNA polymerase